MVMQNNKNCVYEGEFEGFPCTVINGILTDSSINNLTNQVDLFPLIITWVFDGDMFHYSLYSQKDAIDCDKLAVKYNGTGSKNSAEFTSLQLLFTKNGRRLAHERTESFVFKNKRFGRQKYCDEIIKYFKPNQVDLDKTVTMLYVDGIIIDIDKRFISVMVLHDIDRNTKLIKDFFYHNIRN
jgi:hypothetical protein